LKTIYPAALDRIRTSKLAPDNFVRAFGALLAAVNHTGDPKVAIKIDYTDADEMLAPDELVPVITLSFRTKVSHEENHEESNQVTAQDNAQITAQDAQTPGGSLPG
jgi:hypothetical protein